MKKQADKPLDGSDARETNTLPEEPEFDIVDEASWESSPPVIRQHGTWETEDGGIAHHR
jgi:hypothetical protein